MGHYLGYLGTWCEMHVWCARTRVGRCLSEEGGFATPCGLRGKSPIPLFPLGIVQYYAPQRYQ